MRAVAFFDEKPLLHKRCSRCQRNKLVKYFGPNQAKNDGLDPYCRRCRRQYGAAYARDRRANPEFKQTFRGYEFKKKYDITIDDYNDLLEKQKGGCAICGSEIADNCGGHLQVDHCHKWGHVRGLLCAPCNRGLAAFDDNIFLLDKSIKYLRRTGIEAANNASCSSF